MGILVVLLIALPGAGLLWWSGYCAARRRWRARSEAQVRVWAELAGREAAARRAAEAALAVLRELHQAEEQSHRTRLAAPSPAPGPARARPTTDLEVADET